MGGSGVAGRRATGQSRAVEEQKASACSSVEWGQFINTWQCDWGVSKVCAQQPAGHI